MVSLYGAAPGTRLQLPLPDGRLREVFVRGVWRDYARQHGAITIDAADYQRLSGDTRINDLALWLRPGAELPQVQAALERLAGAPGLLDFASAVEVRAASLRIFDRSFVVTYWLQGVAIAIGLFGIAASFSAQVLARRKEFGAAHPPRFDARPGAATGGAGGRALVGGRHRARPGAGPGGQRGAGQGGQPAKFSLDHGPGCALGPTGAAVPGGGGQRDPDRLAGGARIGKGSMALLVKEDW